MFHSGYVRSREANPSRTLNPTRRPALIERLRTLTIDIDGGLSDLRGLDGYTALEATLRWHGTPVGTVRLPVINGACTIDELISAIVKDGAWGIIRHALCDRLLDPAGVSELNGADLFATPHPPAPVTLPLATVAVCTRGRPRMLADCLEALRQLRYPNLETLVVDNAPETDDVRRLVAKSFPQFRYVCEPRPGLDWARNRAIKEAQGEILAYTDDDVIVDPGWLTAIVRAFDDPDVMAVTGLVAPYELETEAQILFERYGGFGRGYSHRWFRRDSGQSRPRLGDIGTGNFGTGANMAYRRRLFAEIGPFDPALDVGTVTNGGGDLEMFYRVLKAGYTLLYEPAAMVRHRHRQDYPQLRRQIADNGVGFYSYLVRSALAHPDEWRHLARFAAWWFWKGIARHYIRACLIPPLFPRDLRRAELGGAIAGLSRYPVARRHLRTLAGHEGEDEAFTVEEGALSPRRDSPPLGMAVCHLDIREPLRDLDDIAGYTAVRLFVAWKGRLIGAVDVPTQGRPIRRTQLAELIVDGLGFRLLSPGSRSSLGDRRTEVIALLRNRLGATSDSADDQEPRLSPNVSVSIVVATYDRPNDLRQCLRSLVAQETRRRVEVVVVDNHPQSGLTPPVVRAFPSVRLVSERRAGLAYARNAGIVASTGELVVCTDDDVIAPPDWLERILAPFARLDVMVVTGNVLPWQLCEPAQWLFEQYGGLGRGFDSLDVDGSWFAGHIRSAVPTWRLGATANAAFRASLFFEHRCLMTRRLASWTRGSARGHRPELEKTPISSIGRLRPVIRSGMRRAPTYGISTAPPCLLYAARSLTTARDTSPITSRHWCGTGISALSPASSPTCPVGTRGVRSGSSGERKAIRSGCWRRKSPATRWGCGRCAARARVFAGKVGAISMSRRTCGPVSALLPV